MTKDELQLEKVEPYPVGRYEELYTSQKTESIIYVDHKTKKQYPLKIRELGWSEIGRIESDAQKVIIVGNQPKDIKFDNAKYRKLCFCAMMVDNPFPDKLEVAYIKLGPDFGNWFSQYIPTPGGGMPDFEEDLSNEL